jgi:prephenate dehydrogenase
MNNSEVLNVHKEFMRSISEFNNYVLEKDEESFVKNIDKSKKYFADEAEK